MLQDNDEAEFVIKALNWELAVLDSAPACATDVLRGHGMLCSWQNSSLCREPARGLDAIWCWETHEAHALVEHYTSVLQVYLEDFTGCKRCDILQQEGWTSFA